MTPGEDVPTPEAPSTGGPVRYVGRYQLLHEIATGGMATVHLARARGAAGFERIVAIKVCHPHLRGDEDFAGMFLDEARLAARIHHPNVVGTLDVGDDQSLYLVMEYIEGDRLSGLVKAANKRGEKVPVPVVLRAMIETLSGLHAAHELVDAAGKPLCIVHRDVSPQNILVGIDGVSRITDFGIAKAEARATVTREGQIKGKMSYMAPEQLASGHVDRRADLYAAGVVLWESLTGRRLFRADSDSETLNMVLHGVVPKPSTLVAGVSPELDALVLRALERDPADRYATAADFADALENGPHKVATTRVVSGYIQELLGEGLARRREILRALNDSADLSPPPARAEATSNPSRSGAGTLTAVERPSHPGDPAGYASVRERDVAGPPQGLRRNAPWIIVGAAALTLVAAIAVGLHARAPVPPLHRPLVLHTAHAPDLHPSIPPSPLPAVLPTGEPPQGTSPEALARPSGTVPPPETPAAELSVGASVHHHGHRGAVHRATVHTRSTDSPATSHPAEFHPGSI